MNSILPTWLQPYFTTTGRMGRAQFWLVYAVTLVAPAAIAIVVVPLLLAMESMGLSESTRYVAVSPIVVPALVVVNVAAFCVAIRRLHDRDKSASWLLLYFGLPIAHSLFGLGDLSLLFPIASLGAGLWFLAECGGLRGTPGVNAYGPPPGYAHVFETPAGKEPKPTGAIAPPIAAASKPTGRHAGAQRGHTVTSAGFGRRGRA